jgi:hypothetical protein
MSTTAVVPPASSVIKPARRGRPCPVRHDGLRPQLWAAPPCEPAGSGARTNADRHSG